MAIASPTHVAAEPPPSFWLARSTRTIFFFAVIFTLLGVYLAFQVPISIFPETHFPPVVIGIDTRVIPVDQMEVTITPPIHDWANSVPGPQTHPSLTRRAPPA